VFNCSESLNYHSVFKLLKGVSATGGFICFDEFNRIHSEVLSVVGQQILAIQNAIRERKGNFIFEEEKVTINTGKIKLLIKYSHKKRRRQQKSYLKFILSDDFK
jgi:hypothetical protein